VPPNPVLVGGAGEKFRSMSETSEDLVDPRLGDDQLLNVSEAVPRRSGWHLPIIVDNDVTKALKSDRGTWRDRLCHFLHQRKVHLALTALLVLDVVLVVVGAVLENQALLAEIRDCEAFVEEELAPESERTLAALDEERTEPHFGNPRLERAEEAMAYASVGILSIFLVENLLLLLALGFHYFRNFFYVFDIIVVTVSLLLEVLFIKTPESGLLVLGRTWRFFRVAHGLWESAETEHKKAFHQDMKDLSSELRSGMEIICDSYYHGLLHQAENAKSKPEFHDVASQVIDHPDLARVAARRLNETNPLLGLKLVSATGSLYAGMQKVHPSIKVVGERFTDVARHFGKVHIHRPHLQGNGRGGPPTASEV